MLSQIFLYYNGKLYGCVHCEIKTKKKTDNNMKIMQLCHVIFYLGIVYPALTYGK